MTIQISDEVMIAAFNSMLNFVLVLLKKEPIQLPNARWMRQGRTRASGHTLDAFIAHPAAESALS